MAEILPCQQSDKCEALKQFAQKLKVRGDSEFVDFQKVFDFIDDSKLNRALKARILAFQNEQGQLDGLSIIVIGGAVFYLGLFVGDVLHAFSRVDSSEQLRSIEAEEYDHSQKLQKFTFIGEVEKFEANKRSASPKSPHRGKSAKVNNEIIKTQQYEKKVQEELVVAENTAAPQPESKACDDQANAIVIDNPATVFDFQPKGLGLCVFENKLQVRLFKDGASTLYYSYFAKTGQTSVFYEPRSPVDLVRACGSLVKPSQVAYQMLINYSSGAKYLGDADQFGRRHGEGLLFFQNGDVERSIYKYNECFEKRVYYYADRLSANVFLAQKPDQKPFGRRIWKDGTYFEGTFADEDSGLLDRGELVYYYGRRERVAYDLESQKATKREAMSDKEIIFGEEPVLPNKPPLLVPSQSQLDAMGKQATKALKNAVASQL